MRNHLPDSSQAALQEVKKIAISFEETVYTSATSKVLPQLSLAVNLILRVRVLTYVMHSKFRVPWTGFSVQLDYLSKINLYLHTLETNSQNTMAKYLQLNSGSNSNRPCDPGKQL